jgi:hypothetical protein
MPTLDWIGKEAVVKHHKDVPFRLLEPVPELSCGPADTGNLIVQGDNLPALKALLPRYAGQVFDLLPKFAGPKVSCDGISPAARALPLKRHSPERPTCVTSRAGGRRAAGYRVEMIFLQLNSADEAVARVAQRVKQGGHTIPESVIRRRFAAGLTNFAKHYAPVVDVWVRYDNSAEQPRLLDWSEKV